MITAKKIVRLLRDYVRFQRLFSQNNSGGYHAYALDETHTSILEEAKRLHASEYLLRNFVLPEDIHDGIIHEKSDPHQTHSTYFVVEKNQTVVALVRLIKYKGKGPAKESFPVLNHAYIYPRSLRRIDDLRPEQIVEVSALVKKRGESSIATMMLYAQITHYVIRHRHRLFIMACDLRLYERLKILFGPAMTKIGRQTPYQGADVMPIAIDVYSGLQYIKTAANKARHPLSVRRQAAAYILKESLRE